MEKSNSTIYFQECLHILLQEFDYRKLWCSGFISLKTILIFPKQFLNIMSDRIENQGIMSFNSNSYKSSVNVVLGNSEVTFILKKEETDFPSFFIYVLFIQCCIIEDVYRQIFSLSILQEVFRWSLQLFCFCLFFQYCLNCPQSIIRWLI